MATSNEYSKHYDDGGFWLKVKKFAVKAGGEIIEKALILYYTLKDSDTPKWAKTTIIGALGYFISPIDAIPDFTPVVGFADDLGVLVLAVAAVAAHIKEEHKKKAVERLKILFGKEWRGNELTE